MADRHPPPPPPPPPHHHHHQHNSDTSRGIGSVALRSIRSISASALNIGFNNSFRRRSLPPDHDPLPSSTSTPTFAPTSASSDTRSARAAQSSHTRVPWLNSTDESASTMSNVPSSMVQYMVDLMRHIATRGFAQGVGSDISIKAFGKTYYLHRLILMQATFFDNMLEGPWKERQKHLIELQFDDRNITREGFEIAIARLYGIWALESEGWTGPLHNGSNNVNSNSTNSSRNQSVFIGAQSIESTMLSRRNVLSVLASAAYLGIDALCDQCLFYAIRTLSTDHILEYVQFSHNNNYYPWSDRIAEACHSFLCRNGFDDPKIQCQQVFERLPAEWLPKVLGTGALWAPTEWDRYKFCRQVVHNRRRMIHSHFRRGDPDMDTRETEEEDIYHSLFSTGIIYMHMTFEQLELILHDCDPVTGHRFTPSRIVHQALWQQTELRAIIDNCIKEDGALGISVAEQRRAPDSPESGLIQRQEYDPIPVRDSTSSGGGFNTAMRGIDRPGNHESVPAAFTEDQRHSYIDAIDPKEAIANTEQHSLFAPFRFSVAFDNIRSYWNVYIQKVSCTQKGIQLGVYLHRHSVPKMSRSASGPRLPIRRPLKSVPAQTWPKPRRTHGRRRKDRSAPESGPYSQTLSAQFYEGDSSRHERLSALSSNVQDLQVTPNSAPPPCDGLASDGFKESYPALAASNGILLAPASLGSSPDTNVYGDKRVESNDDLFDDADSDSDSDSNPETQEHQLPELLSMDKVNLPEMEGSFSCYVDKREKTRTWFKILAVSPGPAHTIIQFQSSPDDFAETQSWGWRSSSLWSSMNPLDGNGAMDSVDRDIQTACAGPINNSTSVHCRPMEKSRHSRAQKGKQVDMRDIPNSDQSHSKRCQPQLILQQGNVVSGLQDHVQEDIEEDEFARSRPSSVVNTIGEGSRSTTFHPPCQDASHREPPASIADEYVDRENGEDHEEAEEREDRWKRNSFGASIHIQDPEEASPSCHCDAQSEYGLYHHHHNAEPLALKLSIVMGHV
ncbi:hypothetical protein BG011_008425 [Mortierella polycephala]|uniref:BTB domain-containing protein n=1 Tax=Mortierella polycephala TaxID=41804 RepID=A0A9P6PNX9_9FUNG|nr:hypothetical protein BG011_008425 [Mortierella polycephala]